MPCQTILADQLAILEIHSWMLSSCPTWRFGKEAQNPINKVAQVIEQLIV